MIMVFDWHMSAVESEVMCMFKAMLDKEDQQELQDQTISKEKFLGFYEVRDLKWKQVNPITRDHAL